MEPFTRNADGTYSGVDRKGKPTLVEPTFSFELEDKLAKAFDVLKEGKTALLLFEDMTEINEHFQATLDWFKARGNPLSPRGRWQQGCKMTYGWIYFCPAEVHSVPTRGVEIEIDLQPEAHELVRQTGLDARLREKGLA